MAKRRGNPILPPDGFVGAGLQMLIDIGVDPAGNVWVNNNWQDWQAGIERRRARSLRAWDLERTLPRGAGIQ